MCGLNRFHARAAFALGSAVGHNHTFKLFSPREGLLLIHASKQETYKSRFNTEVKQDVYSVAKPTLKRWSNRSPTVEPLLARPKTEHQAPTNLSGRF